MTLLKDNLLVFREIFFLHNCRKNICSLVHRLNVKKMSNKFANFSWNLSIRSISRRKTYFEREIFAFSHHKFIVKMNLMSIDSWRLWNTDSKIFDDVKTKFSRDDDNINSKIDTSLSVKVKRKVISKSSISSNSVTDIMFSAFNFW